MIETMNSPAIVEFTGVPGSGKTTLAGTLTEYLRESGFDANTDVGYGREAAAQTTLGKAIARLPWTRGRTLLLWWLFYLMGIAASIPQVVKGPNSIAWLIKHELSRPIPLRLKMHVLWWFFQLSGRRSVLMSRLRPGQVVVVDDGFLHRAVALFASPTEHADAMNVARYVDQSPRPDVVIHVTADLETCVQRVLDRGLWAHSSNMKRKDLQSYLRQADAVLGTVIGTARMRNIPAIEADGLTGDVESSARVTTLRLEELLRAALESPEGV